MFWQGRPFSFVSNFVHINNYCAMTAGMVAVNISSLIGRCFSWNLDAVDLTVTYLVSRGTNMEEN